MGAGKWCITFCVKMKKNTQKYLLTFAKNIGVERSPPFFRTVYPNRNHVTTHPDVFFFFFFFSPQLILQKSNGLFQRYLSFFKVPEGVQHFPGGGGSNCLFPIEVHITCDFAGGGGGPDPLSPPLDPHLDVNML